MGAATKVMLFLFLNIAFVGVSWSQDYKITSSASNKFDWEHPIGSVSICSTKDMMGFQWANNDWRKAAFQSKSFIFRKIEHRNSQPSSPLPCDKMVLLGTADDAIYTNIQYLHRCYQLSVVETPEYNFEFPCREVYRDQKLNVIQCNQGEYVFHPEQKFLVSPSAFSKNVKLQADSKDSFVIAHGGCRPM